jgi:histidine triad (HIT) family protein
MTDLDTTKTEDFYCDFVLNNKIEVKKVKETDNVLAYYHTRPHWPVHIVVIPKKHILSLLHLEEGDDEIILELLDVIKEVATMVKDKHGAARVLTNLGNYQDSKHLHFHVSFGPPKTGQL